MEVTQDMTTLPSEFDLKQAGDRQQHHYLQLDVAELHHQYILIRAQNTERSLVKADFAELRETSLEPSLDLYMYGVTVELKDSIMSSIKLDSDSSLIAYTVTFESGNPPVVVRQHSAVPFETKYHVGSSIIEINSHGRSPYLPHVSSQHGLTLQLWAGIDRQSQTRINIKVDLLGSLGKLVMSYRIILVAFPAALALIVFFLQLHTYQRTNVLISHQQGIRMIVGRPLLFILIAISAATLTCIKRQQQLNIPIGQLFIGGHYAPVNDLILGLQDSTFFWLAPLFVLVSVGILNCVSLALTIIVALLAWVLSIVRRTPGEHHRSHVRRIITTTVLLSIVATIVPYQFAYVVACIVELATCIRLQRNRQLEDMPHANKAYHYNFSLFIIMICILPISLPILAVWIRNLSVQWFTPFSSHHNVLSVAPIILLVECLTKGKIAPCNNSTLEKLIGLFILGASTCIFAYGVMYTFVLHHLFNIMALILLLHHHFASLVYNTKYNPSTPRYGKHKSSGNSVTPSPSPSSRTAVSSKLSTSAISANTTTTSSNNNNCIDTESDTTALIQNEGI